LAGAWPWGAGRVRGARARRRHVPAQRPYLPLGTLRAALAYPARAEAFPDEAMAEALRRCGLAELQDRLNEEERWDACCRWASSSAGLRAGAAAPARWVFLDEATAALDEETRTR
jgi:putative ATP-binding cassette transporter